MPTITLQYTVPQTLEPLLTQSAALLAVALQSPTANNELDMLGNIAESIPRTVTVVPGPPPELRLTITYATTADFMSWYPNAATRVQALNNLWSQRISLTLRTRVRQSTPTIV